MGNDEVGDDAPVVNEPGRRRATYTPPVRRKPAETPADEITHDDDELASALEEQVSQLTISTPTVSVPDAQPAAPESEEAPAQDVGALSDDQVVKLIDDGIASNGDTLSAIEK